MNVFSRFVLPLSFLFCFSQSSFAKDNQALTLKQVAAQDSTAILALMYWGPDGHVPAEAHVEGSGFLIGREGFFITAAHMLEHYKAGTGQLVATIHQRDGSGGGVWFDVIEIDKDHDLALCKLSGFVSRKEPSELPKGMPRSAVKPISSLTITTKTIESGELIAITGFALGSFVSPVIQLGNIAATDALLDAVPGFPGGRRELLIVSASGNHGDSGCPVISLESGEVLGMIIQYVPAPLLMVNDGGVQRSVPEQSGLMVAVPAKWISAIMSRHGVKNDSISLKEHLVF